MFSSFLNKDNCSVCMRSFHNDEMKVKCNNIHLYHTICLGDNENKCPLLSCSKELKR